MNNFLFKDREGQTPLPEELRKGLIPTTIQFMGELDEYEEENIFFGLVWLEKYQGDDFLTYPFWLKLHKKLFENVWKWAGIIRKHELANPYFLMPYQIWPALRELEKDLAFWIENHSFSDHEFPARFHERVQTIHPFPNGNGRFGRVLTEYVCQRLKLPIPSWGEKYRDAKVRREDYIQGLNEVRTKHHYTKLIEFMYS